MCILIFHREKFVVLHYRRAQIPQKLKENICIVAVFEGWI